MQPAKPELVQVDTGGQLRLCGGQCECGYRFFPMQTYGCERCGRDGCALTPLALAVTGEVLSSAEVHVHRSDREDAPRPPFAIGAVRLDDGPTVRALLLGGGVTVGARVQGQLVPSATTSARGAHDPSLGELRFALVGD